MGTKRIHWPDHLFISSEPDHNCITWTLTDSNGLNVADNYPLKFATNKEGGWNIEFQYIDFNYWRAGYEDTVQSWTVRAESKGVPTSF